MHRDERKDKHVAMSRLKYKHKKRRQELHEGIGMFLMVGGALIVGGVTFWYAWRHNLPVGLW
jgi:hypothetical protein